MDRYAKTTRKILALLLLLYISVIATLHLVTPDLAFSETENRVLEQLPHFSLHTFVSGTFTSDFEKYVSDQFAFRDVWVGAKTDTDRILGKKESNGIFLGKDGYLIQKSISSAQGDLKEKVEAIHAYDQVTPDLRKYVMLVPTAVTVLEDKLPRYAPVSEEMANWRQVTQLLHKKLRTVDVTPPLMASKDQPIYYKTDHHWTTRGAFIAYQELGRQMGFTPRTENEFSIRQITGQFYGSLYSKSGFRHIQPDAIELYDPKTPEPISVEYVDEQHNSDSMYAMNNLATKDKYTVFFNGNHSLIQITTRNKTGRKLLIVKDSYANSLIPFLTSHFSEIDVIDLRYYDGDIVKLANERQIHDMLILYNIHTFCEDPSITKLADYVESHQQGGIRDVE